MHPLILPASDHAENLAIHPLFHEAAASPRATSACRTCCTSWPSEALGRIPLDHLVSNGYAFLIETLHEALRHGARIGEVPIVFVERRHGHSKVSLNVIAESLAMPWRVRFRPHVR